MALAARWNSNIFARILTQNLTTRPAISGPVPSFRTLISPSIAIPSITITIPGLISDIWEGILRAVPKKKTSHSKKRHRQLAGKALKDVKAINQCHGCGRPKKAHTLCPYCVSEIYESWNHRDKQAKEAAKLEESMGNFELEVPAKKEAKDP